MILSPIYIPHIYFDIAAVCCSFLVVFLTNRWRYRAATEHLARSTDGYYAFSIAFGAIAGAYILGTLNLLTYYHTFSIMVIGRSILGALVGAITAIEIYKWGLKISSSTEFLFAIPFAVPTAIGRWGCYFSGFANETQGIPTTLPWGVMYGDEVLRHPVQLYESASMALFALLALICLKWRPNAFIRYGFYFMTLWYGAQRFAWEFLKPYGPVLGPFNIFHITCAALVMYSIVMIVRAKRMANAGSDLRKE